MSSDIAIQVKNISKCYQIYDQPQDRLKQSIVPRLQKLVGRNPTNYYRDFWAIHDISFEVKRGESVGILGRNGSGKSTLLQLITGNLSPTTGSVEVNGRVAALLELGSGFNPEFSGRENVYLNGTLLGLTREQIDDRFDAIAAFADIGEFIEQPVKTYSSGMLVRLAFSVQVQVEPDILIVDEALAVGDALFQKRCFQRIEQLLSDGVTLLFVSHDIESVRTLTSQALLLQRGEMSAWGYSADVIREYRRQLHADETSYFSSIVERISEKIAPSANDRRLPADAQASTGSGQNGDGKLVSQRSESLSFGDGEVCVNKVSIFESNGAPKSVFMSGEMVRIMVTCRTLVDVSRLNVAIRIRNKEGVKVYSWGTLNQDMARLAEDHSSQIFWNRRFAPGEEFSVNFEFECDLGTNLYEVQAAVSYEETPDYLGQRILHWVDEAAFFQSVVDRRTNFFGGLVDLGMQAKWSVK